MSDDFDDLFDTQVPPSGPSESQAIAPVKTPASASASSAVTAPATFWLPVYRPGMQVRYKDTKYTVSHVLISKGNLFVHVKELESAIPSEKVNVEWTKFTLHLPLRKI